MKQKIHRLVVWPGLNGEPSIDAVLCNQRHRRLIPLLHTDDWARVTCQRCLQHRPLQPLGWFAKILTKVASRVVRKVSGRSLDTRNGGIYPSLEEALKCGVPEDSLVTGTPAAINELCKVRVKQLDQRGWFDGPPD